jgi:hypothetical protein
MTSPPFALTAFTPRLPSAPVPERIAHTARSPNSSAKELRKKSRRHARAGARAGPKGATTALDREVDPRWNDVDMLAFDRHSIVGLLHFHLRMAAEQRHHHALVRRVEMLDQDEGHPAVGGHRGEQLGEGFWRPPAELRCRPRGNVALVGDDCWRALPLPHRCSLSGARLRRHFGLLSCSLPRRGKTRFKTGTKSTRAATEIRSNSVPIQEMRSNQSDFPAKTSSRGATDCPK